MDYARYDNQATPSGPWIPDQGCAATIMQPQVLPLQINQQQQPPQPQPQPQPSGQPTIKPDTHHPQHSQETQQIIYAAPTHQPMTNYDMPVNWTSPMTSQSVIQVPQWSQAATPIGHPIAIEPSVVAASVSDPCINPTVHSQQSHYAQYSTVQVAPTYWNPDLMSSQPSTTLRPPHLQTSVPQVTTSTATAPQPGITDPVIGTNPALIENPAYALGQPGVSGSMPTTVISAPVTTLHQQPPTSQFEDQLTMSMSASQSLPSAGLEAPPGSLEDALEVIKNHAENFSAHRPTCSSSTSGDDDDDHSRGPRTGEREKERRQANNARER